MNNQAYLLAEQYRDDSNLASRMSLHERFSTNPYGFQRWIFDRLDLAPDARVLELGCGTGVLWLKNRDRLPEGWDITLSDLSPGMLDAARVHLGELAHRFAFRLIDAQSIPYEDGAFDAVIACHMLYHVNDRAAALREVRRVLRGGGQFYATANGRSHLRELDDLIEACIPDAVRDDSADRFGLERGAQQLKTWFAEVTLNRYPGYAHRYGNQAPHCLRSVHAGEGLSQRCQA